MLAHQPQDAAFGRAHPGHAQPSPELAVALAVEWAGTFLRETVDDQAEVLIGTRTHRLPKTELRPA
jgi:hypothetical protein